MKPLALIPIICFLCAWQQQPPVIGPFAYSTNFAADLYGTKDTRPGTWGYTRAYETPLNQFKPPVGYRTRILRVYGDFIACPVTPSGGHGYALFGLQKTGFTQSGRVSLADENTLVYYQLGMSGNECASRSFDVDVNVAGLLQPDNTLQGKVASFLNDTGSPIHVEPTFTAVYRFERQE